ncbi:hypothetical protein OSTOST_07278 [Ostertagia ostertagi]
MEAELYFSAYDALHQGKSAVRRLELRLQNVSSIGKIVWSSFDFMCGPEMKFVWEVTSSSSVSPVNLSGEEGSVNDAESLDSSMSTQSAQYEDIDDPLETDLTCTAGVMDDTFLDDSVYHEYHISSRNAGVAYRELRYLDEFMVDSHYSKAESNCTMTDSCVQEGTSTSRSTSASTTATMLQSAEDLIESEGVNVDESTGPIDPMVGTPMELMNISTLLSSENPRPSDDTLSQTIRASRNGSECSTKTLVKLARLRSLNCPRMMNANDKCAKDTEVVDSEKVANVLTTSCVDSGIGGTISTHSELSAFCLSPSAEIPPNPPKSFLGPFMNYRQQQSNASTPGSFDDDVVSLLDLPIAPREDTVADEVFVSKFVLSEQVFSTQLPSNPLMHKVTVVPSRNLLVGSFIFSVTARDGNKTIHAISFLMSCCKQEWYLERQPFLESAVLDTVPKIKAAMIAIKNTLLTGKRCHSDKVLCKAISGVLQSQGYCVIIGSNTKLCVKVPYVRLQAVRRCELPYVMQCGALSSWPICVVDVDRATVCMSPPYSRHRVLKQRADAQRINIILDSSFRCKPVTLEMTSCRVLECVKTFLRRIDLLPLEESARMGLVNQLMLYVENAARALILYVQHASEPLPSEKNSATKSSRFSLNECRRALDLQSDSWFHAVLARAELIVPDIAEFIYNSG